MNVNWKIMQKIGWFDILGCDAYADENGEVEIRIGSYEEPCDSSKQEIVCLTNLDPYEKIYVEWIKGEER